MNLNDRAARLVETLISRVEERRVRVVEVAGGGRVVDCGVESRGGVLAGLELARICMADLAEIGLVPGEVGGRGCPSVQVATDHAVASCLASQYAGWQLAKGDFFAMGSGPMRAASGTEKVFHDIGFREEASAVVGVLEGRAIPGPEVVAMVAESCRVAPSAVTLLVAPTASLAGGVQVVARSVETGLHKLHEQGFDLGRIVSAFGSAPLPPVAGDDLAAIGRTNDAILYGARVVLDVTGDDASLEEVGPMVPSSSSRDHGEPFAAVFARYNHDFYAVDPHLFSPAEVVFRNVETGNTFAFGRVEPGVLARSFGLSGEA
ncbi:methenyltetrahydromethanopterin cyclohydrolase [Tautonia plasticadhaerens]|uniref:Methenyltetrahydromethanopterin cyclohydrolase n=1 Tax=Tautonia plasticadhaerens TaxID=2527974 RepID=A0A518HAT2_9BACT|nr:methenyltetrahydromethanopterin cyclohydrolase [Tautonia plasticadhaerens]QDV37960.1 Methenyltetrahydromethanopterin cyclohydrolase [Tautonia plasticadhaerens]